MGLVIFTDVDGNDRLLNTDFIVEAHSGKAESDLARGHRPRCATVIVPAHKAPYVRVDLTPEQVAEELAFASQFGGPYRVPTAAQRAKVDGSVPMNQRAASLHEAADDLAQIADTLAGDPGPVGVALAKRYLATAVWAVRAIEAGLADPPEQGCEGCGDSSVAGARFDPTPGCTVQRCDTCAVFEGDLEAALAVAAHLGGTVKFERSDGEVVAWFEGATLPEGLHIAEGTDPWIEATPTT